MLAPVYHRLSSLQTSACWLLQFPYCCFFTFYEKKVNLNIIVCINREDLWKFVFVCLCFLHQVCNACPESIPLCEEGEVLTVDANSTDHCCPDYQCGRKRPHTHTHTHMGAVRPPIRTTASLQRLAKHGPHSMDPSFIFLIPIKTQMMTCQAGADFPWSICVCESPATRHVYLTWSLVCTTATMCRIDRGCMPGYKERQSVWRELLWHLCI